MFSLAPNFTQREYRWTEWKALKALKSFAFQYSETSSLYTIWGYDGPEVIFCIIWKTEIPAALVDAGYSQSQNDTDKSDFETNFKSLGNSPISPKDTDGTVLSRNKAAPIGWIYCLKSFELETSKLNSIYSKKYDDTDANDCAIKLYDSSNAEITNQLTADVSCVKTVLDFEPPYDYEIIGGKCKVLTVPTVDVRLWIVAVPDIPEVYGGTKTMVSGFNIRYLGSSDSVEADGRASKRLSYNATYHTNKLRFILRHPAGHNSNILLALEMYKL